MNGKYYCVPNELDNSVDEFSWFWEACDEGEMTVDEHNWYKGILAHYPQAITYDESMENCDEDFKDGEKVKTLNYQTYNKEKAKLADTGDDDSGLFLAAAGLLVLLN